MTTHTLTGASEPDDVRRGLAALERFTAAHAPESRPASDNEVDAVPDVVVSKRVRQVRAEVAEAHALLGLQADEAPLLIDSPRVRRRRRAVAEAARLHALGQDPAALAWRAARWRRTLTTVAMTALVLALGWSTAGVQKFAAGNAVTGSAGWWLAWLVEPLISLALLFVVGARAFFASRGQALTDPVLGRIEVLFLTITIVMNVWPYLPGVADRFMFSALLIHAIGPIVAVSVVTAMPRVWHGFTHLDLTPTNTSAPAVGDRAFTPAYTPNERAKLAPAASELLARVRTAIAAGELPEQPTAYAINKRFKGGMPHAQQVRDTLAAQPQEGPS